ncbi:hypothetical protein EG68_04892 [Paragonimus skrjabini miyazakii]|uniref:Uncharacterized protein n=1 Tax=Paragonimus skrjabini miyazakii TaxID=59628 RepID=A0A8S9YT44_9TREM|nr:hypothetical protein EG68_04892 [Paragonimus skrjabini miyazakii]
MQSRNSHDTCFADRNVTNISPTERLFINWQSLEEYENFIEQANEKCSFQINEIVRRLNQFSSDLSEIFMFLKTNVQPEENVLMYQSHQLMKLWNSLAQLLIEWTALFWDGNSVDALGRSVQPNPMLHLSYDTHMELLSQTCLIANYRLDQLAKHSREKITSVKPSLHLIASLTSEIHQRSDGFTRIALGQSIFPHQSSCVEHSRPTDATNLNVIIRQVTFDLERWREQFFRFSGRVLAKCAHLSGLDFHFDYKQKIKSARSFPFLLQTVCSALQDGLKLQIVCTLARWHHRMCYPQPQTGHCNQLGNYLRARVHQLVSVLKTIQLNVNMNYQHHVTLLICFMINLQDFLCLHGANLPRAGSTNESAPADALHSVCTDIYDRSFWTEDLSNRHAAFEDRFVRTVERAQHMLEQGRRVLTVLEQNRDWLKQAHRLLETIRAQPSSPTQHVNHNTLHVLNDLCTELKCLEQRWIGVVWNASAADKTSVHGLLNQMNSIRRRGESWCIQTDLLDEDDTPTDTLDPLTSIVSFAPSAVRDAIQFGSSTPTDPMESSTWPSVAQLKLRNSHISVVESVSVHPISFDKLLTMSSMLLTIPTYLEN